MRLFLLGATGRTGAHVLDLALARGHEVTAFVRMPQKIEERAGLQVVVGDPRTGRGLAEALAGHTHVISVLGSYARDALRPSTLMTDFGESVSRAMVAARVRRVALLSAAVLFPGQGLFYAFFRWFLRNHARDLEGMESAFRAADLDWTIARPPRLVQGVDSAIREVTGDIPPGGTVVSYRAVASWLLEAVETGSHVREVVGIAR
jgi:putative NADH-flavin reductase